MNEILMVTNFLNTAIDKITSTKIWYGNGTASVRGQLATLVATDSRATFLSLKLINQQIEDLKRIKSSTTALQFSVNRHVGVLKEYENARKEEAAGNYTLPGASYYKLACTNSRNQVIEERRKINSELNEIRNLSDYQTQRNDNFEEYKLNVSLTSNEVIERIKKSIVYLETAIFNLSKHDYDDILIKYMPLDNYTPLPSDFTISLGRKKDVICNNIQKVITKLEKLQAKIQKHIDNHIDFENNKDVEVVLEEGTKTTKEEPVNYTVKSGDNLSIIAREYGMTWEELYAANKDVIGNNPNLIEAGMILTIPGITSSVTLETNSLKEVVTSEQFENISEPSFGGVIKKYDDIKANWGTDSDQLSLYDLESPFQDNSKIYISSNIGKKYADRGELASYEGVADGKYISGRYDHSGTDYSGPGIAGTPVNAIGDGIVIATRNYSPGGYGKEVLLLHEVLDENNVPTYYISRYGHFSSISGDLKPGMAVDSSTNLGKVGSTGRSTGPHLHLELAKTGLKAEDVEGLTGEEISKLYLSLYGIDSYMDSGDYINTAAYYNTSQNSNTRIKTESEFF